MIKEIKLTAKRQRTEVFIYGICLLIAFALNVFSIFFYKTDWKELYTQLGWVFMISLFLYFSMLLLRLFYQLVLRKIIHKKLFVKKKH